MASKNLEQLMEDGYGSIHDLERAGIKNIIDYGDGDHTIVLNNDSEWDYMKDSKSYELNHKFVYTEAIYED